MYKITTTYKDKERTRTECVAMKGTFQEAVREARKIGFKAAAEKDAKTIKLTNGILLSGKNWTRDFVAVERIEPDWLAERRKTRI